MGLICGGTAVILSLLMWGVTLMAAQGSADRPSGARLSEYLPLKLGEVLKYRVRKADEAAAVYMMTLTVEQAESLGHGEVFSTVVRDSSQTKPKPRRMDLFVDTDQITDMSGPALLRTPLRVGESWTTPAWSGKRSRGQYQTTIVANGPCRINGASFGSCIETRERNPLDGTVLVRRFVAQVGLAEIQLFRSELRYQQRRPERTETLIIEKQ